MPQRQTSEFHKEIKYMAHFIHYDDVIMSTMASQINSLSVVCSTVYLGANKRKHQSSASLAFMRGIHWWPVNFLHSGPITRKMFLFDEVFVKMDFMFREFQVDFHNMREDKGLAYQSSWFCIHRIKTILKSQKINLQSWQNPNLINSRVGELGQHWFR